MESEFGITGVVLDWFRSYLSGRTFAVRVGSATCSPVLVFAGVPQGSVLGPLLYTVYASPVGRLIESCNVGYHAYADDTQLFTALKASVGDGIGRLVHCAETLQTWFWQNGLLLNPDKSEVIFLGTRQRLTAMDLPSSVSIAGCPIQVSATVKILGVKFDRSLTFADHVNDVVRACNFHLRALHHIRRYMSTETARTIAFSIVGSRLDYCNALFTGMDSGLVSKLQRVQNNLARVVCSVRRDQRSGDELLRELHWLPINSRIQFKVALLCFKSLRNGQPSYLHNLLQPYVPTRSLRSSDRDLLVAGRRNLQTASRRFSLAAPRCWNLLPLTVRRSETVDTFKSVLKTHVR
jgi:hypothetical protein